MNATPQIDIGIDENPRQAIAMGLTQLLADSTTLYFKTHSFHWNVTGPMFRSLHNMFEEQYNEMWMAIDVIAERIRALGSYAPMSWEAMATHATVPEATDVPPAEAMLRQLVNGHETVIKTAREMLPVAEKAGDEVTVDLLTQRMQIHEKTAWMLRSMLK